MLTITRFNNETFEQNKRWREINKFAGCIYGIPKEPTDNISIKNILYVIEMNNTTNTIEGIGIIVNKKIDKSKNKIRIYDDRNYNRYIYVGSYRIDKSDFIDETAKTIKKILEIFLFKGSKHSKRGQGINILPNWISNKLKLKNDKSNNNLNYKIKLLLENNISSLIIEKIISLNGKINYEEVINKLFMIQLNIDLKNLNKLPKTKYD